MLSLLLTLAVAPDATDARSAVDAAFARALAPRPHTTQDAGATPAALPAEPDDERPDEDVSVVPS